jgi:uncharacterized membrane protein YedE/YeeE
MYGIIGCALVIGTIVVQSIKRFKIKSFHGENIHFNPKAKSFSRYMFGGIIFGLGWALAGACPGPMFTLVGAGFIPILVVIASSIVGTCRDGVLKDKLPH